MDTTRGALRRMEDVYRYDRTYAQAVRFTQRHLDISLAKARALQLFLIIGPRTMIRNSTTLRRAFGATVHLLFAFTEVQSFIGPRHQVRLRVDHRVPHTPDCVDSGQPLSFSRRSYSTSLKALVPVSVDDAATFLNVGGVPNAAQYFSYFGRTQREKYARATEAFAVTIVGVFLSYFLSFLLGPFVSTVLAFLSVFWGFFGPELEAYQRNWELLGGRRLIDPWYGRGNENLPPDEQGLYAALFLGVLNDICVVEYANSEEEYDLNSFADYRMEEDDLEAETGNPYLLRIRMDDTNGRELQVHARMSEEYLDLQVGQSIAGVLLARSPDFRQLSAMTDFCVPDAMRWIGDYPYLDRRAFEAYLVEGDEVWDMMEDERLSFAKDAGYDLRPPSDQRRRQSYQDEDQRFNRQMIKDAESTPWVPESSLRQEERFFDDARQDEGRAETRQYYDDSEY